MNLPNGLTLMRIFLVPLLVAVLLTQYSVLIAAAVFLAASLTDLLDGYFARKRGQITTLGTLLDPVADKLLISSAFISLVQLQLVPAWTVVIIIGREFAVTGLRSIASAQGFTINASQFGKIKMVTQVAAITFLILGMPGGSPNPTFQRLGFITLGFVVIFAVVSAVEYFWRFWTQIDDRFKAKQRRRLILLQKRQRRHGGVPTRDVPTH